MKLSCLFFLDVSIIMNSQYWKPQESLRNFLSYVKCKSLVSYVKFLRCFIVFSHSFKVSFAFLLEIGKYKKSRQISICELRVISERNLAMCSNNANQSLSILLEHRQLVCYVATAGIQQSKHIKMVSAMFCNFLYYSPNHTVTSLSAHSCQLFDFLLH